MANRGNGSPFSASFLGSSALKRSYIIQLLVTIKILIITLHIATSQVEQQETTHDGIVVFEYNSYRSVSMVSYQVPEKTSASTWIIKSYPNNGKCPVKNITLQLRHSGYPLTNPWNDEYPDKFKVGGASSYIINLRSDNISVAFFAMNPLPGNWYGAAYIREKEDNRIAQKGIGISCTYLFRVSQVVITLNAVAEIIIPAKERFVVYNLDIPSSNSSHISRFIFPEGITAYSITVTSCYIGDKPSDLANITCPLTIYTEALSLPKTNSAATNCSKLMSVPCVHSDYRPAPNVWNYLGIIKNTNGSLKLKLTIMYEVCRSYVNNMYSYQTEVLKDVQPTQVIPKEDTFSTALPNMTDVDGLYMVPPKPVEPKYNVHPTVRSKSRSRSKSKKVKNVKDEYTGCIMHPPMEKRRRTELYFMYDILYPDLRSNGHGLNITDTITVSKFHLQAPNLDGGGTMNLKVQFTNRNKDGYMSNNDVQKNDFDDEEVQNVRVQFCFQKNVIPVNGSDILCDSDFLITINTSAKIGADWLFVPYPEEGPWYLAVKRTCYIDDPLGTSNIILKECKEESTEIVFILDSMPCVEKDCNGHGKCTMYYSNVFFFSSCKCQSGYRGYGCSDSRSARSHTDLLAGALLLTMSNLLFAPAAALAFYRRYFVEGIVYLFTMFFSTFYHACDQDMGYSLCIIPYNVLSYCDFYGSFMSFAVTLITMSKLHEPLRSVGYTLAALFLAFGVEWDKHSLWVFAIPIGVGLVLLLVSWSCMCHKRKNCFPSKKRWILFIVPGALIAIIGCCLFAFVETTDNYAYVHSSWHIMMAAAVMFVLPPRVKEKRESQESLLLGTDVEL